MSKLTFLSRSSAAAIAAATIGACTTQPTPGELARATEGYIVDVNKVFVVDCLLPGQLRKLGGQVNYLSARRPIRTSAADCEVRGGEYVAYDRANYASALQVWLPKAEEGDDTAQLYVGQIFEKGLGRAPDYGEAAKWYRKSAEQGNAQAQINLGHLYERGLGVQRDGNAAMNWYGKASGLPVSGLQFASAAEGAEAPATPVRAAPESSRDEVAAAELRKLREASQRQSAETEQLRARLSEAQQQLLQQQTALRESQEELVATRRRLAEEKSATQTGASDLGRREEELRQKEAQLQARQAELQTAAARAAEDRKRLAGESMESERQRAEAEALRAELQKTRQELEATRRKAVEQKPQPGVPEASLRQLEEEIRQKESKLRTQQAQLDATTSALAKEQKRVTGELAAARRQAKAPPAVPVQAAPAPDVLTQAREQLAASENAFTEKTADFKQKSSELTALLMRPDAATDEKSRAEIDTRKSQLAAQGKEIAALKETIESQRQRLAGLEQKGTVLAQGGPDIEILKPTLTVTRGVLPSVRIEAGAAKIIGRVTAPAGLQSLLVNGQPVSADASGGFRIPLGSESTREPLRLAAIDRKNRRTDLSINLVAGGAASVEAASAPPPEKPAERPGSVDFGRYYALIIGNNRYAAYPALQTAVDDVKSMDVILRERYGFTTKVLLNANRHDILTAFNQLKAQLTEKDNLLIYYAGHGEIDPKGDNGYWLPTDAEVGNPANWLSSANITDLLSIMPARHIMVVADSCYSGALSGSAVARLPDKLDPSKREKWLQVMNTRKARTVLTSGGVQPVSDQGGSGHSVFANALLKVLRSNQNVLEDYEVFRAVAADVQAASARNGLPQSPQYAALQHAGHEGSPFFFVPAGS